MTLKEKIDHARQSSAQTHELLPVASIREWIDIRTERTEPWLISLDDDSNRKSFSYAQFGAMVQSCARALIQAGLQPGDRIATIAHNHWQTVVYYFAAWYAGLTVVPVNITEDDDRIRYVVDHGQVKWAFILPEYESRIRSIAPELVFTTGLMQSESDVEIEDTNLEMEALIVYTSGTTGNPKGVVLTQANMLEDARAIAQWHRIDRETRMMCVLPIHHVNGTVVTLLTPFYAGASVVLTRKFHVTRFFDTIQEEGVHVVSVVPTLLQYLNQSSVAPIRTPLRHIVCGAGPLTVSVARTFETKFGIRIIHGYGLSETTCYSCYLPLELSDEEHASWIQDHGYPSIGTAMPVNEMAIHDDQGRPLGDAERGEIVIRGANVMKGYYANDEANEMAFIYGWFRSGDEGFAITDASGRRFFFITGRIKELIIRGGVNLAPLEIDEVISRAPGVKTGIAVGFENDWYGEEVGAFVQMIDGAEKDAEAILEYCRAQLPFAKCPKVVVFGEQIPVTSTGKYQRMKVAHLFSQWKETQFRGSA